jgi:hypothetical protein
VGNPEGNRLLRRSKWKWEDNIKIHLKELDRRAWIEVI